MKINKTFRKFINDIHLWLGIGSGIILFIVCLTGTILAFEQEIKFLLNKNSHTVETGSDKKSLYELKHDLEKSGQYDIAEFIIIAKKSYTAIAIENKSLQNDEKHNEGEDDHGPKRATLHINPYSGDILPEESFNKGNAFFLSVMKLHRWLLLDIKTGRPIVGIATITFIILCLSGFILWLPKKLNKAKQWKQGFSIKWKSGWKRINYDVHNTLGFYALIPLLIMGLSGLIWSFPGYYKGLENILGDKLGKQRFDKTITLKSDTYRTSFFPVENLMKETDSLKGQDAIAYRITFPQKKGQTIMVRRKEKGFFASDASDKFQFNPYTGKLVEVDYFKDWKFNEKVAALIRAIHIGSFMGYFSKIIYFFCCLIATTMPITGTLIWINKLKKNNQITKNIS